MGTRTSGSGLRWTTASTDTLASTGCATLRPACVFYFLSCEPLLEDIGDVNLKGIHWVIVGGESGQEARPFDLIWARTLKENCERSSAAFFFKQLGKVPQDRGRRFSIARPQPNGKRDLHGVCRYNFPPDLDVQDWPRV